MQNKTISIPGSKSITNRALIMAALTEGAVSLKNPLYSDDTNAMIGCLKTLGMEITEEKEQIIVHNDIRAIKNENFHLFASDSGTTARFLLALLAIVPGVKILTGNKRLNERPIKDLIDSLRGVGACIEYCEKEDELPLKISSSSLTANFITLRGDISSQFCSSLLMIAPYLSNGLTLELSTPLISKSYVDMTIRCMQDFGVKVFSNKNSYFVPPSPYKKKEYVIEGDYSSASYFFAISALTKTSLTIENLSYTSVQPDRQFLKILEKMGSLITYEENKIHIQGNGVKALDVDMEECPDQVMTVAVLAAFAKGVTTIKGVRSLRTKECERVFAIKNELQKMNIKTEDTFDTLTIYGGNPNPAEIETYNDHRIAMSFAVASRQIEGMVIQNPEVVDKTFPTFWEHLKSLS